MDIDSFLSQQAFAIGQQEKSHIFASVMHQAVRFHYDSCPGYRQFLEAHNFEVDVPFSLTDLPPLPTKLFKSQRLLSVPAETIRRVVRSSGTTGSPSVICLDQITISRQRRSLVNIMTSFLGKTRQPFFVFDSAQAIQITGVETSSRSSGLRGMAVFAKQMHYVFDKELRFDLEKFHDGLKQCRRGQSVIFWGFTWMIDRFIQDLQQDTRLKSEFQNGLGTLGEKRLLHVGGQKNMHNHMLSKEEFRSRAADVLATDPIYITDLYGMTEHLGTTYPDCEAGYKHAPLYSEVIVRDRNSLNPLSEGQFGLLELLTPLPQSYPGIAILTEDLGVIRGVDDCLCGRKGTYFTVEGRQISS